MGTYWPLLIGAWIEGFTGVVIFGQLKEYF